MAKTNFEYQKCLTCSGKGYRTVRGESGNRGVPCQDCGGSGRTRV